MEEVDPTTVDVLECDVCTTTPTVEAWSWSRLKVDEEEEVGGEGNSLVCPSSSVLTLSLASIVEATAAVAFVDNDAPVVASSEDSAAEAEVDGDGEEALIRVRDKTGEQWDMLVVPVDSIATMLLLQVSAVELLFRPLFLCEWVRGNEEEEEGFEGGGEEQ